MRAVVVAVDILLAVILTKEQAVLVVVEVVQTVVAPLLQPQETLGPLILVVVEAEAQGTAVLVARAALGS
jgi:hypothetical protein